LLDGDASSHPSKQALKTRGGNRKQQQQQQSSSGSSSGSSSTIKGSTTKEGGPIKNKRSVVQRACVKCGNPEQEFYTRQMRSVDEGSTTFYECNKCGNVEKIHT
jgi:DNA-directed RNA polymerase subunit M/transcription elongation factor TFIIS